MSLLTDAPTRTLQSMAMVADPPMDMPPPHPRPGTYPQSTRVEVRNRFDGSWTKGFEVAEVTETGYRIRRSSDASILPAEFTTDEVRKERGRSNNWWV
jgi:hypothetical protein